MQKTLLHITAGQSRALLAFLKGFWEKVNSSRLWGLHAVINDQILPKIHGEVMQETPPPASSYHSTPAALTPLNRRRRWWRRMREGVSSPPIIPCLSFFLSFPLSAARLGEKCTDAFLFSVDANKEQRRGARGSVAFTTSRERNEILVFFLSERERLQSVMWGSSLYSSHPSLCSLPVYSTCHLPSLPWWRLHMLPAGGRRGGEEEGVGVKKNRRKEKNERVKERWTREEIRRN